MESPHDIEKDAFETWPEFGERLISDTESLSSAHGHLTIDRSLAEDRYHGAYIPLGLSWEKRVHSHFKCLGQLSLHCSRRIFAMLGVMGLLRPFKFRCHWEILQENVDNFSYYYRSHKEGGVFYSTKVAKKMRLNLRSISINLKQEWVVMEVVPNGHSLLRFSDEEVVADLLHESRKIADRELDSVKGSMLGQNRFESRRSYLDRLIQNSVNVPVGHVTLNKKNYDVHTMKWKCEVGWEDSIVDLTRLDSDRAYPSFTAPHDLSAEGDGNHSRVTSEIEIPNLDRDRAKKIYSNGQRWPIFFEIAPLPDHYYEDAGRLTVKKCEFRAIVEGGDLFETIELPLTSIFIEPEIDFADELPVLKELNKDWLQKLFEKGL